MYIYMFVYVQLATYCMFFSSPLLSGALVHAIHLVVRMRFARRPFDRW